MKVVMLLPLCLAALALAPSEAAVTKGHGARFLRRGRGKAKRLSMSGTMESLYPYYHGSDAISAELQRLASEGSCPGLSLQTVGGPDRSIDVATIRAPGASPINKNFLLFGEHARELISAESGLHFIRSLCGETDLSERAKSVLQDNEFQIVVNGNPDSRKKVETGDFCLRVNPNGVDLNRNWDEHWEAAPEFEPADTNPGPKPFSEPETQAFKQLVEAYRPTTFLTVHSGTKGMYMPWAFDMEHLAQRNQPQMLQILKALDKDHCECPFGAAGREVGYSCPGTCLDWVYDNLQAQYAFAFEIFVDAGEVDDLRERWQEKIGGTDGAFLQENSHLGHEHFKDLFTSHPSGFVQLRSEQGHESQLHGKSHNDCFAHFNPSSEEEYKSTVENWSAAYLDMAAMVASNLKNGMGNSTAGVVSTTV